MESSKKYLNIFSKARKVLLMGLLISILVGIPLVSVSQKNISAESSSIAIAPIHYQGERYFGDLLTRYSIDSTGKVVVCTLYLSTVFVGVEARCESRIGSGQWQLNTKSCIRSFNFNFKRRLYIHRYRK